MRFSFSNSNTYAAITYMDFFSKSFFPQKSLIQQLQVIKDGVKYCWKTSKQTTAKLGIWPWCKFWFHLLGWCFCWLWLLCFSFCGKGSLYLCVTFDITYPTLVHHLFQGFLRGLKQLPLYKNNPCLKMHVIAQAHSSACANWLALNWYEALSCLIPLMAAFTSFSSYFHG